MSSLDSPASSTPPSPSPSAAAGWYPEPGTSGVLRYWNGASWEDWRQAATAAPVAPVAANGLAVTALVFALVGVGLDLTIIGGVLGFPSSIVGLICGIAAIRRAPALGRRGMALWGFWLSAVALVVQVVLVVVLVLAGSPLLRHAVFRN